MGGDAIVQQESYDIVAIVETWWDGLHNWSVTLVGYKLFRRDSYGSREGGVALYVKESFDCLELKDSDDRVECLRLITGWGKAKVDIIVGACYRQPNKNEEAEKTFL